MEEQVEQWKPVPGFETKYLVSNYGRLFSLIRKRPIRASTDRSTGYQIVGLLVSSKPRKYKSCRVHTLVMRAFVGEPREGQQGAHKDGDPTNNKLSNLRWSSARENMQDQVKHGTRKYGQPRLTTFQRLQIEAMKVVGYSNATIADHTGCTIRTVQRVYSRMKQDRLTNLIADLVKYYDRKQAKA